MTTIQEMMNRIKGLSYHEVTIALSAPLQFNGVVPFDTKIEGDLATFRVLAETYAEAECKVWDYIRSLDDESEN
jgi:hypothetical protein